MQQQKDQHYVVTEHFTIREASLEIRSSYHVDAHDFFRVTKRYPIKVSQLVALSRTSQRALTFRPPYESNEW
jgi:hypothetical protein